MKIEDMSRSQLIENIRTLQKLNKKLERVNAECKNAVLELPKMFDKHKKLESIINRSPAMVFLRSLKQGTRFEFISENVEPILGYTSEEFKDGKVTRSGIVHPEDLTRLDEEIARNLENGVEKFIQEFRLITKSGEIKWMRDQNTIISDQSGTPTHLQSIVLDITDHKETEEALRKSEEKYRELVENMNEVIYKVDERGMVTYVSPSIHSILGYKPEEIEGNNFAEFMYKEDFEYAAKRLKEVLANDMKLSEYRCHTKSGEIRWLQVSSQPILKDNDVVGIQGILIDVTDRRRAEEQIIDARNRAELYLDILGHDITNLNQTVITASELLLMKPDLSNQNKKYVKNSLQQAKAISDLIDNVRKLSDLSVGEFNRENIEASKILADSFDRLNKSYPEREISINHSLPESGVYIKGNELLQDVFDNILGNAVKFNRNENVVLDIAHSTVEEGKFWKLEFKDNGPGVPDEMKENIFKRFERGSDGVSGFGIGLTIVNEVVNLSGGKVWVEDRVSGDFTKGSNFIVMLPKEVPQ